MLNKLEDLFSKKAKITENQFESYSVGESFPIEDSTTQTSNNILACYISLYCVDCIELLPDLKELSESFNGEFLLFTDGNEEENKEIRDYFKFSFMVRSYTKEELANKYKVVATPYVYVLDSSWSIICGENINDSEELKELLEELKLLNHISCQASSGESV
ncbi:thioredoxin-like domain-containing protein [Paenibacillus lautus]|uniref:TlpA family protein disulfide reductase n=1 Tax=Paenibacillus lautus TaxID=1401 RepID=UPI003D2E84E1